MEENKTDNDEKEKRGYFRVDDVIPVVVNPVAFERERKEEILKTLKSSKAFSLLDISGPEVMDAEHVSADFYDNKKILNMISEINTKLDFIINHLMLDNEGLSSAEKKMVNISATGIRLKLEEQVKENDILEMKLLLPMYPPVAVFAYGEVKRVQPLEDGTFEVSVEYINMDDSVRDEIIQYTLSHQRSRISRMKDKSVEEKASEE